MSRMAAGGTRNIELVDCKEEIPNATEMPIVLGVDSEGNPRNGSFSLDCESSGSEQEKWSSVFSSGSEEPQWAQLQGGIIHPNSRKYTVWAALHAVLVAYWTFATWLIWGFIPRPSIGLVVSQALLSCFFGVDLALRFRLSYLDTKSLTLVQDPAKIAKRYLRRGFILDVVSIVPFDFFFYIISNHPSHGVLAEVLHTLPLLRMFRLTDTFHLFSRLEHKGRSIYHSVKFGKLALLVCLSAHIAACLLWFTSRQEVRISGDASGCMFGNTSGDWQEWPLYKKWITAFYWSVLTISSIGYGDYMPVTQLERILVCFYEIFGLGVLSFCLGSMEVMLVRDTNRTGRYHDKVRALNEFALRTQLPPILKGALKQHLVLEMAVDKVRPDLLTSFPHHLKAKVLRSQYKELVARTVLFQGTSSLFLDQVLGDMNLEIQLPNTAVVLAGDVAENLYVVISGSLTRESADGSSGDVLGPGAVFGKVAVLCNVPQVRTVRTLEVCELLKVDKAALQRILKAYPEDNRQMLANLQKRIGSGAWVAPPTDGAQALALELTTVLEQQDTEVTRHVCNTAARGNATRLAELLSSPGVENGTDYDGRAPLHFAALAGHKGCVEVLIKGGANVNAKDRLGRTPLLEAVLGGHPTCVSVLLAAGAQLHLQEPGRTLCNLAATGATATLATLVECRADPNATDYDGRSALHVAAVKGAEDTAQLLLRAGADPDLTAKGVPSPRAEAQAVGHTHMVRLFEQA